MGETADKIEVANDPIRWIEKEFFIPETRKDPILRGRFKFMPHQADIIREAFRRDENGRLRYDIIIYSDIKKSWKSSIAAAVALWRCDTISWSEQYVVANDLKQADSRVNHYIRRAISLNPKLKAKYRTRGYRTTGESGSFIEAIPIDPSGEAGSNPDSIFFSELWGANEQAKQHMWTEMAIPPGKHGQAFRWVESYAGFAEESELLYSLYELGVKQGELLWPDKMYETTFSGPMPLELYANKKARVLCYWGTVPRLPDQTEEYYASEANLYATNEFLRIHRNQWVSKSETFVPQEWLHACRRTDEEWPAWKERPEKLKAMERPFTKENWPVIIALDAAVSGACFGLFMGCRHPDIPEAVMTLYAQIWNPPKGGKIDYVGTQENPGPELVLRKLLKEYNVVEIAYDEYQLHFFCSRLKQEGLGFFRAFPQGNDRLVADNMFRGVIRDKLFWYRGEKDLEDHIQNADAKIDPEDRRIRIVKRVEKLHVDLAVCGSMCTHELMRLNL